jgi:ABC-type transport system involved in multi-copper enzyme maturation permease subunit
MNAKVDAIPEKRGWVRVWDALVDANPVLAKELLVTARTPIFVASMIVAPVLLASFVMVARLSISHAGPLAGRQLFPVYFAGLSVALGIVGAALGSTVVVQEREVGALEALKFSALSPSRIAVGKFAAVVLAEAAVVLCTLPLLGFVLATGGVSLGEAFVALAIALACGIMSAAIGIAVSSNVANTRRSLLVSLVGAGALGIGVMIWLAVGDDLGRGYNAFGVVAAYLQAPLDGRYIAFLYVLPAYALATILWFGHAAATSGLMDPSEDRSRPIKHWILGAYATGMLALAASSIAASCDLRNSLAGGSMIATALLAAALLFDFAGEPVRPTRRMQVRPRSLLARAASPSCLAPSVLFILVTSGAVLLAIPLVAGASAGLELAAVWSVLYLTTLGGFMGAAAAPLGKTRARQLGAAAIVGLTFLFALLHDGSRPSAADVICPLWVDAEDGAHARYALASSLAAWAVAALVSLAAMGFAVRRARVTTTARS